MKLPVHHEGLPFIATAMALQAVALLFLGPYGWLFLPILIWVIAFFRDPERQAPTEPGLIISPADGKMLPIIQAPPPEELGLGPSPRTRLSIFMNVFNVHVNRSPITGTVVALSYRPGKFFNASFDKASIHNERMSIRIRPEGSNDPSRDLVVVQIAGLVARRIVCHLQEGQQVHRGERFGIIRFGSRLDVYLQEGTEAQARPNDITKAGQTILALVKDARVS